mgnify:CR=1 FL=1
MSGQNLNGRSMISNCRSPAFVEYEMRISTEMMDVLSVNGGIHGSTEYGKLSTSAQRPKIAEWRVLSAVAYPGSCFDGKVVFLASVTKRF